MSNDDSHPLRELTAEERDESVAMAEKARAEARKFSAEADQAEARAALAQIERRDAERKEAEKLAGNLFHHLYHFSSGVDDASVSRCMDQLTVWHRQQSDCEMEIIFTSPGGSIIAGMMLFDFIQTMRRAGHHVVTGTLGMAASMAGILLQAGDHRWMGKEAYVLIHQASFGAQGTFGKVEDEVKLVKMMQRRIVNIFAQRAKVKASFIERNWKRTDWWLSSDDCLKHGFVDEVR